MRERIEEIGEEREKKGEAKNREAQAMMEGWEEKMKGVK